MAKGCWLIIGATLLSSCASDEGLNRNAPRADIKVYTEGQAYLDFSSEALRINLGEVPVFATKWALFQVENPTGVDLEITSIDYNEEETVGQRWGQPVWADLAKIAKEDRARPLEEDGPGVPFAIPVYETYLIGFPYSPLEEGTHQAKAIIYSNATNGSTIEITIEAQATFTGVPDIQVQYGAYVGPSPEDCVDTNGDFIVDTCRIPEEHALDFGNIGRMRKGTQHLYIRNTAECEPYLGVDACTICSLTVDKNPDLKNIGFGFMPGTNLGTENDVPVDSGGRQLCFDAYDEEGTPVGEKIPCFSFLGSMATPFPIAQRNMNPPCAEPGEVKLRMNFDAPNELAEFKTVVIIESNDPDEPVIEIPVRARASDAPIAIAKFRERDPTNPSAPWTNPNDIQPLARVYFDGRDSYDSIDPTDPSRITTYRWEVIRHPSGLDVNDFQMQSQNGPLFSFWLPFAGEYTVQLKVTNRDGMQSGDTEESKVEFDVIPGSRMHIQLSWDDSTNDQDLHLMYLPETENLCYTPWDCYFSNKTPQWFDNAAVADGSNPRLDIDDTHGLGPENINIDAPEPGTYRIAIHYWADYDDHSPTRNTVRVYLNGLQVGEYRRTHAEETEWLVGDITWLPGNTGFVTPYPSDAAGQIGTVTPFLRSDCSGGF